MNTIFEEYGGAILSGFSALFIVNLVVLFCKNGIFAEYIAYVLNTIFV